MKIFNLVIVLLVTKNGNTQCKKKFPLYNILYKSNI